MQLRNLITPCLICLSSITYGQDTSDDTVEKQEPLEIDILSAYYNQDGQHSPVTGGRGTEALTDISSSIIINLPIGKNVYNLNLGTDNITSASTDNIDNTISSDSKKDLRTHANLGVTRKLSKRESYMGNVGFSTEYDVTSLNVMGGYSVDLKKRNIGLDFKAKFFYDNWDLYRPVELSKNLDVDIDEDDGEVEVDPEGTDTRQTYNLFFSFTKILTRKLQFTLATDIIYQSGLISTPFHRVYFNDGVSTTGLNEQQTMLSSKLRKSELLPNSRLKTPVSLRLHYYVNRAMVVRVFYRYYYDNFGLSANTIELELPLRIKRAFTLYPFYRYHHQSAAKYFKPFGEHNASANYYTSDYDLSTFNSTHVGLGIKYEPLFGIGRNANSNKKGALIFKSIDFRAASYSRSDGLTAYIYSFGISIKSF